MATRPTLFLYENSRKRFIPIEGELVFGRTHGAKVYPKDELMSRSHCRVFLQQGKAFVEDLRSTNKTKVNSIPLDPEKPRLLHINDVIEFGEQHLVLTGQNRHAPGGVDRRIRDRDEFEITQTIGGSLREASRLITAPTKLILTRESFFRRKVDDFKEVRRWDVSTIVVTAVLGLFWTGSLIFALADGAGAGDLNHGVVGLLLKFLGLALVTSLPAIFYHQSLARSWNRRKQGWKAYLALPLTLALSLGAATLGDLILGLSADVGENLVLNHCVRRFDSAACRRHADRDSAGFNRLPREVRDQILLNLKN